MNDKSLVGTGLIVLAVLGVIAYLLLRPMPGIPAKTPQTPAENGRDPSTLSYEEHKPAYDIEARYPSETPLKTLATLSADTVATTLMKDFVDGTVQEFKQNIDVEAGRKLSLTITYSAVSAKRTVSYIFTVTEDTGGAHGNMYFRTFTFDTKTGDALAIGDLFVPESDYLARLSSLARAKLPALLGDALDVQTMRAGTAPEAENFSAFYFDNDQLKFLFPPYQIAAYAAGPYTLQIPRSELVDILRPEYR